MRLIVVNGMSSLFLNDRLGIERSYPLADGMLECFLSVEEVGIVGNIASCRTFEGDTKLSRFRQEQ